MNKVQGHLSTRDEYSTTCAKYIRWSYQVVALPMGKTCENPSGPITVSVFERLSWQTHFGDSLLCWRAKNEVVVGRVPKGRRKEAQALARWRSSTG